jgi:eukaryotic-like serine/threonine-protein kinase
LWYVDPKNGYEWIMTETTINIESSDYPSFEKTFIITDGKIKTRTSRLDLPFDKTIRDASLLDLSDVEYRNLVLTESEKKYYGRAIHREMPSVKYKFQGKLISGGMGAILEVIDQDLHRPVAMKVIKPSFKNEEHAIIEFIREAKITAMLEHPNIIPVHELGLSEETGLYFTMKLMKGEPLNLILKEIRKENPEYLEKFNMYSLLNIFRKICDAVDFAHSKNIIHRDIKPHNVIVGHYGEVLLMDWGLARYIGDLYREKDLAQRETLRDICTLTSEARNIIQGSPAYMAPEQTSGESALLDKKTDIFLLAATLYQILTLEPPYTGKNLKEVLQKANRRDLPDPQKRSPDRHIPDELCRIVMKATELKKEDRYSCVQDLINDLDDVIAGRWLKQEKKVFSAGRFLMKEGEDADEAYLITKGKVQVFRQVDGGSKVVLGTLQPGDIVGEMALITDDKRSASVEALEETEAAVLTKDLLSRNLKKLPPYIEKMLATLTRRLQTANAIIHPHLASDCSPFVLQQMCFILRDLSVSKKEFALSFEKLCARISDDLGLPVSRVEKVLLDAANDNLLTIQDGRIFVADIHRIMHAAELVKSLINR